MVATLVVAVVMAACLWAAALFRGTAPTRTRVVRTAVAGIAAAVLAWMFVGMVVSVPDSATVALGLWLIVLSVVLVRSSIDRRAPDAA